MEEVDRLRQTNSQLVAECARLTEALRDGQQTNAALAIELMETNRGVVALYAEVDNYSQQLRNASELKSRFLTYMSHEFRTPLGAMRSLARILLDRMDGELTDEQEKQVLFIERAALELTNMVNDLLDLAKLDAGRITLERGWFSVSELFASLEGLFLPIVAKSAISIAFENSEHLPRLCTDEAKLSIILRNFISNGLKFTTAGEVRIAASVQGEKIQFSVSDTGIGISAENLPTVFEDWMQISSATQKRLRGSGLGLSLSRRYAKLLGGSVTVDSDLGIGSRFVLTIPQILQAETDAPGEKKTASTPIGDATSSPGRDSQ